MLVQRYPTVAKGTSPSYGKSYNIVSSLNKNSNGQMLKNIRVANYVHQMCSALADQLEAAPTSTAGEGKHTHQD